MKNYLTLLFVVLLTYSTIGQTTAKELLLAAHNKLMQLESFDCTILYQTFPKDGYTPLEQVEMHIIQKGIEKQFVDMADNVYIVGKQEQINIDKVNKVIAVSPVSGTVQPNEELMRYIQTETEIKLNKEEGFDMVTIMPKKELGMKKIIVKIDNQTNLIVAFTMFFESPMVQSGRDVEPVDRIKVKIAYKHINKEVEEALFEPSNYYSISQSGLPLAKSPYQNYSVTLL